MKLHVYKVINKINNKIYIGQSSKHDMTYMGSGPVIIKAVRKYGKDNFDKEIIEFCETKEELNKREIFWINFYDSTNRNTGYNISIGGNGGNLGELVNKKISKSSKGKIISKDINGNIFHIDANDERFLSGELVGIMKGIPPHNKGIPMSESQKLKLRKPKPKTKEYKDKMSKAASNRPRKKIICLTNGIVYQSMRDAACELNLTIPNIINVLKGRAKKTKGYSFNYL